MAAIAQEFRDRPGTFIAIGGIHGALAAWMWTTTPAIGGFFFGETFLTVYFIVYESLVCLGDSKLAQITRFALGVLAGAAAAAAIVSPVLGFTATIEAATTLSIAMVVTLIWLAIGAHLRRQQAAAAQQQRA